MEFLCRVVFGTEIAGLAKQDIYRIKSSLSNNHILCFHRTSPKLIEMIYLQAGPMEIP